MLKYRIGQARPARWLLGSSVTVLALGLTLATVMLNPESNGNSAYVSTYVPQQPAKFDYLHVTILGDSYTGGIGAPDGAGFARILSDKLCWNVNIQSQSGTGYVNPGPNGGNPYIDRVPAAITSNPAIIILQGSVNDLDLPNIRNAAEKTFKAVRKAAPNAAIIAVGPTAPPETPTYDIRYVRDEVEAAAKAASVPFVDPIAQEWMPLAGTYQTDGTNLTPAGHLAYASRLAESLEHLNLPRLNTCQPS
ncbi:SGNH/GDSL hydrolase family protein [Rhodococcus koreensis]